MSTKNIHKIKIAAQDVFKNEISAQIFNKIKTGGQDSPAKSKTPLDLIDFQAQPKSNAKTTVFLKIKIAAQDVYKTKISTQVFIKIKTGGKESSSKTKAAKPNHRKNCCRAISKAPPKDPCSKKQGNNFVSKTKSGSCIKTHPKVSVFVSKTKTHPTVNI